MLSLVFSLFLAFQPFLCNGERVLQLIPPLLGEKPIIVEAGAYDGQDTMILAQRFPKGLVLTFEPHPVHYESCKKKFSLFRNILLSNKGLSDKSGTMTFYLSEIDGQPAASSSVYVPHIHTAAFPWVHFPGSIAVPVTSLDEVFKETGVSHVDFFWLDVQGHELALLKGCPHLEQTKALWCEVSFQELYKDQPLFNELRDFLYTKGFVVVGADFNCRLDGEIANAVNPPSYGNAFFVKKSLLHLIK